MCRHSQGALRRLCFVFLHGATITWLAALPYGRQGRTCALGYLDRLHDHLRRDRDTLRFLIELTKARLEECPGWEWRVAMGGTDFFSDIE